MIRATVGATIGFVIGCAVAYGIDDVARTYFPFGRASADLTQRVMTAAILAVAGAVVGATGDLVAYLRKAFPPYRTGPEADFRELPRPK